MKPFLWVCCVFLAASTVANTQPLQQVLLDADRYWFGTSYKMSCPGGPNSSLVCEAPDRARKSILARLLGINDQDKLNDIASRISPVTIVYNSPSGNYIGCGQSFTVPALRNLVVDPTAVTRVSLFYLSFKPSVTWRARSRDNLHTVIIWDPGYYFNHGLYINVPGGSLNDREVVRSYIGPLNPFLRENTYVFAVYEQTGRIDLGAANTFIDDQLTIVPSEFVARFIGPPNNLTACSTAFNVLVQGTDDPTKNVVISLADGQQLRGLNTTSSDGDIVYKFYGIPYAVPPLGDLRFKPPKPAADWTGVKDAIKKSAICPQETCEDLTSARSEDCLFLNVFTPDVKGSLPVLVWIHGGTFQTGSAYNDGDGATLAPRGVVAVTINYRLGPFGFLSSGDDVMPGNYGMLDQVLTLKWVKKYIKNFGGDPKQVTIGGESSGAISTSLHIASPLSKGRLESGSAVVLPSEPPKYKETLLRSASRVGCDKTTSGDILLCLQKVDVAQIIDATRDSPKPPRVETIFGFLPDDPINILKAGNYNRADTPHGTNSGDYFNPILDFENDGVTKQEFNNTVRFLFKHYSIVEEIVRLVTEAYVGNETDPIVLRETLVHAEIDYYFGGTLIEENLYTSEPGVTTKHFLYEFDYRISGTTTPIWQGVAHAAERRFVFYPDVRCNYITADDRAVGEAVQTMWVNFIKYGDPTPSNTTTRSSLVKWSEFTKSSPNLLKIDAQSKLVPYPRLFLIPLFEKLSELIKSSEQTTIVG